ALTEEERSQFQSQGFVVLNKKIPYHLVKTLRERAPSLFRGEFETGVYPDEWYGREGMSLPHITKEICNVWKSDRWFATVSLSAEIHRLCAEVHGWEGSRIGQDNIIVKPAGVGSPVHYHQDSPYVSAQFTPEANNSVTCWIPLVDVDEASGTIEYAVGSHRWPRVGHGAPSSFHGDEDTGSEGGRPEGHGGFRAPMLAAARAAGLEPKDVQVKAIRARAGTLVLHHQDVWHGSGPHRGGGGAAGATCDGEEAAAADRSALSFQVLSTACRFRGDRAPGYIYGRYRLGGRDKLEETFFPVCWRRSAGEQRTGGGGGRTGFLGKYLHEEL
ncbi:unnamed protein product, partial [Heterosigma akashiwo]